MIPPSQPEVTMSNWRFAALVIGAFFATFALFAPAKPTAHVAADPASEARIAKMASELDAYGAAWNACVWRGVETSWSAAKYAGGDNCNVSEREFYRLQ